TMTKVIKEELEKLGFLESNDDSFACNTPLGTLCDEFNRLSRIDDDLFTYEVVIPGLASIPCDPKEEDDSDNDDEVVLTGEESSDPDDENLIEENEVAEIFRIKTNVFDFETPTCRAFKEFNYLLQVDPDVLTKDIDGFKICKEYKDDWIYKWNKDILWVNEKPWTDNGAWEEPTHVEHYCEPFLFKSGHSEWPTCSRKDDGYCNGGNLPGAYIVGNTLRYQDLEWYEALKDGKLKDEALKNKAIVEGIIDEDEESHNEALRRWDDYKNTTHNYEMNDYTETDKERRELFNDTTHERSVCEIRRFEIIKYSFGEDEKYVAVKEHEYDDVTSTNEDACRTYQ
ncbi:hypothetical protein Tco_1222588, partial [Tanacetum coccineum]